MGCSEYDRGCPFRKVQKTREGRSREVTTVPRFGLSEKKGETTDEAFVVR